MADSLRARLNRLEQRRGQHQHADGYQMPLEHLQRSADALRRALDDPAISPEIRDQVVDLVDQARAGGVTVWHETLQRD